MSKRNRTSGSRRAVMVLAVCLVVIGGTVSRPVAVAAEKMADKPVKKAAVDPKSTAAVLKVVQELQKEYAAGIKEKIPKLRDKSDYFADGLPPEITLDAILAALEKPMGSDRGAEAYVKWQLLSAYPAQFPPEQVDRAAVVYKNAPVPNPHPGLNHSNLEAAIYRAGITKRENEAAINAQFRDALDQLMVQNTPILNYRNELFGRLPVGWPAIAAGVADLEVRASRGVQAGDFWKTLSGAVRGWAALGPPADQLNGLTSELTQLRASVANDKNKVYTSVAWVDQPKYQGLQWHSDATLQPNLIDDLLTVLKNSAMNPGGGIKFKDAK